MSDAPSALPPDWQDRDARGSYYDAIAELRRRHLATATRPPAVTSIATPLDRAWQRYRAAVQDALDQPTEAAVLRRDAAREVWLALFVDRAA